MTVDLPSYRDDSPFDPALDLSDRSGGEDRVILVGTYPPTACGIASYTANLRSALVANSGRGRSFDVLRLLQEGDDEENRPEVVAAIVPDDPTAVAWGRSLLEEYDLVLLQHEFGIYGEDSGRAVLDLLGGDGPPVVTTLHTVSPHPAPRERNIVFRVIDRSAAVAVHSEVAAQLLTDVYGADPAWVAVIPHGAGALPDADADTSGGGDAPPLLTWGLIGPGKGLEWVILALPRLRQVYPGIRYVIAGRTHPKVLSRHGEAYRQGLIALAGDLGVEEAITMVDHYLSPEELAELIVGTALVVLPYESTEQTSSGVLTEAVTAGVPVVATAFPHAVELAERGAVSVVPHRDPVALGAEIERILGDPVARASMLLAQEELASSTDWNHVSVEYLRMMDTALEGSPL